MLRGLVALITSQHYVVRGESMSPAFRPGHRLLVRGVSYAMSTLSRGDVVVVRDRRDAAIRYLKRVVSLPGEKLQLIDGMLFVNGVNLPEPYLEGLPAAPGVDNEVWRLGGEEFFVLGDNRVRSTDSRDYGPVSMGLIVGRVWFRYWPLRLWGRMG